MNIEKVTIKNFRNYVGEHHFNLDKKITIFYGDNGFGKSSFFDAIEWCISGTISRFHEEVDNEKYKKDLINKFVLANDNTDIECCISIEFNNLRLIRKFKCRDKVVGSTTVKITDLNGRTIRNSDDKLINSKEKVDEFLSGISNQNNSIDKNMFGRLMKKTYILSQDQVTQFISSKDPGETFRSIVNIMGFIPMLKLSDNMKKVLSKLESKNKILTEELEEIQKSILSKQETKRHIDTIFVNKNLKKFSLNTIETGDVKEIKEQLIQIRDKEFTLKLKEERLFNVCSKLRSEDFFDLAQVTSKITELKESNRKNKNLLDSYKILKEKSEQKILRLNKIKSDISSYNINSSEIQKINQKLQKLKPHSDNIDQIKYDIKIMKESSIKYQFILSFSETYQTDKKIILKYNEIHKELEEKLSQKEKIKKKRNEILTDIDKKITETEDGILVNLLNNIKEINTYIENNKQSEVCPVCSSKFEEDSLEKSINKNINKLNEKINYSANYAEKLLTSKRLLRENLTKLNSEIKKIRDQINDLTLNYDRAKKNLETTKQNEFFDPILIESELSEIRTLSENNDEKIKKLENVISLFLELENLKNINGLELDTPSLFNEEKIIKSLNDSKRVDERIRLRIASLDEKINTNEIILSLGSKSQEFTKEASKERIDLPFVDILEIIEKNRLVIDDNLNTLSRLESDIEIIMLNNHIEKQINQLVKNQLNLYEKSINQKKISTSLSDYIEKFFGDFGDSAKNHLNHYDSPIQKYFRYLNPLPTRSSIKFEGKGEKLFIKVIFDENDDENDITTPRNVLSSGQLNVLAISVFLAMNDSQKVHDLDFIAIDDPIQNMDDINQFSICDVLGSIKKQLIFSTHNFEFLKLFMKKNEHKKELIQIYNFKSPFLIPEKVEHLTFDK